MTELPGCYMSGETLAEIEENVKDAIAAYLESMEEAGESPPEEAAYRLEVAIA